MEASVTTIPRSAEAKDAEEPDEEKQQEPESQEGDPEDSVEPAAEPKPIPPMQIALPGDFSGISSEFGGAAPEFSEVRLLGGKMPIEGSFEKGTTIRLVVEAQVVATEGRDVTDEWGAVKSTVRRHHARMIRVERA